MIGNHFYHGIVRKLIVAFGTMFNQMQVTRKDENGSTVQSMKVPLAYGPKHKWLTLVKENESQTKSVAITLPRMSFELSSIEYDPERKLNRLHRLKLPDTSDTHKTQFSPVPYNASILLYIYSKNSDEALQLVEQILPYFQPDYTITIRDNVEMEGKRDIPIILNAIDYEDTYESDAISRRAIVYTLTFTAKFFLYGPITSQKIIKKVNVDQYTDLPEVKPVREQRYSVEPDTPDATSFDDDFGFNEMTSFYTDLPDEDV